MISLRNKMTILFFSVTAGLWLVSMFVSAHVYESNEMENYRRYTSSLIYTIERMVKPDLEISDYAAVNRGVSEIQSMENVEYIGLYDSYGNDIAIKPISLSSSEVLDASKGSDDKLVITIDDQVLNASRNLYSNNANRRYLGKIFLGVSIRPMYEAISKFRLYYLLFGMLLFLSELVLIHLISKGISKPIKDLVAQTRALLLGRSKSLELRTDIVEIQELVNSYNSFSQDLDKYRGRIENDARLVAIGQMSSHIAHDMRSPLSVLKSYVGIKGDFDEADVREYRKIAERSVLKLLHMADDLVNYSKASNVDKDKVNLRTLVCDCVLSEINKEATEKKVTISCDIDAVLNINCDSYRLGRALTNVAYNALQAVKPIDGRIDLFARAASDVNLVLAIKDNGHGISFEDLPHIFDSFFTKGKKGGTGLGLAYCKQVVEAHGGTIDVESEEGKGTTFTITIPNCVVDTVESCAYRNEPRIKCDNRRFIIIDDDADIRMRWRRVVQASGGTVAQEASSLEDVQAREKDIDYDGIDVAMVDYHYEGSDYCGTDVIQYMRDKGVGEVHLCTGHYDDEQVRNEAFAAGADSVMPKG
jgi:signal transduction histidine kinase/CheY-like chemotaxis protein